MKKKLAFLLTISMFISIFSINAFAGVALHWTDNAATSFAGGDGSVANPYQIANASQLAKFAKDGDSSKSYILTADINLAERLWIPKSDDFTGVFDGRGHTISNMTSTIGGFLSKLATGGAVINVSFSDVKIRYTDDVLTRANAIVAASNYGTIDSVSTFGSIECYSERLGSMAGFNSGIIRNCYNKANVTSNRDMEWNYVGGISGTNEGGATIINCVSTGSVDAYRHSGAVVGYNVSGAELIRSFAYVYKLSCVGTSDIAAINEGTILYCPSTKDVTEGFNALNAFVNDETRGDEGIHRSRFKLKTWENILNPKVSPYVQPELYEDEYYANCNPIYLEAVPNTNNISVYQANPSTGEKVSDVPLVTLDATQNKIYGGFRNGDYFGDTYIFMKSGTVQNIYGGNMSGKVVGNANIIIQDGIVTDSITGGNSDGLVNNLGITNSNVRLLGGSVESLSMDKGVYNDSTLEISGNLDLGSNINLKTLTSGKVKIIGELTCANDSISVVPAAYTVGTVIATATDAAYANSAKFSVSGYQINTSDKNIVLSKRVAGKVDVETVKDKKAPETKLTSSDEEIRKNVLTAADEASIAAGIDVNVSLKVTDISDSITKEDKELVLSKLPDGGKALFLDISLFKFVGDDPAERITSTSGKVKISIKIPDDYLNADGNISREFYIIRVHNGESEKLEGTFDEATGLFTFETDKFSTYALSYVDTNKNQQAEIIANTADTSMVLSSAILTLASISGLYVVSKKKSEDAC